MNKSCKESVYDTLIALLADLLSASLPVAKKASEKDAGKPDSDFADTTS